MPTIITIRNPSELIFIELINHHSYDSWSILYTTHVFLKVMQHSPGLVVGGQSTRHLQPHGPGGRVLAVVLRDEAGAEHLVLLLCAVHSRGGLEGSCTLQSSKVSVIVRCCNYLVLFQTWHYLLCTMLHLALSRLLWRDSVLRLLMVPESRDKVWHVEDTWPREPLRHEDWPLPSWHGGLLCLLQQDGASGGLSSEKDGLKWTNDGGYRIPDNIVEGGGGSASRQWSWDWFWCDRGRADVRVSKLCDNSITCHDCVTNLSLWRWCPLRRSTATLCLSLQNTRFVWIMSGL